MPTSVRLDTKTERLVERLARAKGRTKSEVIREAIVIAADRDAQARIGDRPYEAVAHLIGAVRGGPRDLSVKTGEKFRRLLVARKARRR